MVDCGRILIPSLTHDANFKYSFKLSLTPYYNMLYHSKEKLANVILDVAWVKKGQRLKFSDYYSKSKKTYLAA